MTYAGLGMMMLNVISLHCERCGVSNARSLNALSYRNVRSNPHAKVAALCHGGKASLSDGEIVDHPLAALHQVHRRAGISTCPFCPVEPFFCRETILPPSASISLSYGPFNFSVPELTT